MLNATESYTTTEQGKKYRFRFLPGSRVSEDQKKIIEEYMISFTTLYNRALKYQKERVARLGREFLDMIKLSSEHFDR